MSTNQGPPDLGDVVRKMQTKWRSTIKSISEVTDHGKPKIFSPLTLLGFQVVDSYCFQSTACEIAVGSCRSASRVV